MISGLYYYQYSLVHRSGSIQDGVNADSIGVLAFTVLMTYGVMDTTVWLQLCMRLCTSLKDTDAA